MNDGYYRLTHLREQTKIQSVSMRPKRMRMLAEEIRIKLEKMEEDFGKFVNEGVNKFYEETGLVPSLQMHNASMMGDDHVLITRYKFYFEVTIHSGRLK